jgi:DNA transformation protein
MFGGHGIYHNGLMIGLIADDVLHLKVDDKNRPDFEASGSRPFTYQRKNRKQPTEMSYWEVPPEVFEDADTLCHWAGKAHNAAARAKSARGTKRK